MIERCAGIIVFKRDFGTNKVLLVHPGGPYFKDKDYWGIPKGHIEDNESPVEAAIRECEEEVGIKIEREPILVGTFLQNNHKKVTVFAVEQDFDLKNFKCNTATIEYPSGSGKMITIQENDRAEWFDIPTAERKVFLGQVQMLREFELYIGVSY